MPDTKSEEDIQKDIEQMREWILQQPHFPTNIDGRMIRRFLHSCYYDLDKTKKCMELFFTIRANCSELLSKRDPTSDAMRTVFSITNIATLRLRDNSNLLMWRLIDPGMEKYDYMNDARMFFCQTDIFVAEDDFWETRDVVVLDVGDVSLKFLKKFNMSVAKKLGQYQQEAVPVRLKEVHLINCPSFIDKLFSIMKPFLSSEMAKMVHFHTPNSETLYKYVNKEELPSDYGGRAASMAEHMALWVKRFEDHRDLLLNEKLWVADLAKGTKGKLQSNGLQRGTFKNLELD